jgi:regulator of protease activity HflC (stomatin/prohibitin superfamily)
MDNDEKATLKFFTGVLVAILGTVGIGMWGCPTYNVYSAEMSGKAELAQAEQNGQIAIAQSKAKAEAAEYEANAEVTRAEGVAKANKIIGDSLKGNEDYLRYLWVNNIENSRGDTIVYVPTEANMPIMEATRLQNKQPQ